MKLHLNKAIIVMVFVCLLLIGIVLFILVKYTSFIVKPSQNEISQNNGSSQTDENLDLVTLETQELVVPKVFRVGAFSQTRTLNLPKGFEISVFAANLPDARGFDFTKQDNIIVAARGENTIYIINSDNEKFKIDSGLNSPNSIEYYNGDLYVGEKTQIDLYKNLTEDGKYSEKKVLVSNLPSGGHSTRTVLIGPDQKLYVAMGSSCNLCEESDPRRAAIMRYNLDGTGGKLFASGLRNTVDFVHRETENALQFWGVDNGRDLLGDDLPPEEVNLIQEGKNYGWPYCYGDKINNPEYPDKVDYCKNSTSGPAYEMQAHSAPLGLAFFPLASNFQIVKFPESLKDNLFITFHGSWNRSIPTGYKVVRIDTSSKDSKTVNFITGWLDSTGSVWGRPVGIRFNENGDMFISDDQNGAIYIVKYVGK